MHEVDSTYFGEPNVKDELHISNPSSALRAPSPRFRGEGNTLKALGITLILVHSAFALPSDQEASLSMRAGTADLNQTSHQGTYRGGITLDQGTTHLRAEKGKTLTNERHQVIEAIIEGNATDQAHFWSLMELDQPILHAYADKIYFYPQKHFVKLEGHAKVVQGQHHVEAPVLEYDLQTHHVQSFSQAGQQTVITIQPEPKS